MRRSREQWVEIVEQFERSGQSHDAFCAQQRLNVGSFRVWLYRLRSASPQGKVARSATRLLPVRVAPSSSAEPETVIELAVGEAMVRVRGDFGPAYVAELVTLLRSRC
ncbi:MAG TPA: hypothetical protein VMB05_06835 [Solirubrobacteraceae bacterium]|nr:hypothetical protein [Solirubrobacteraceae bacterium]